MATWHSTPREDSVSVSLSLQFTARAFSHCKLFQLSLVGRWSVSGSVLFSVGGTGTTTGWDLGKNKSGQKCRTTLSRFLSHVGAQPARPKAKAVFPPDILALKHESRKFRYCRDVEKSSRLFSSQCCQAAAGSRSPNRPEQKTSTLNFRTTQKNVIFLLPCFRTRMSAFLPLSQRAIYNTYCRAN